MNSRAKGLLFSYLPSSAKFYGKVEGLAHYYLDQAFKEGAYAQFKMPELKEEDVAELPYHSSDCMGKADQDRAIFRSDRRSKEMFFLLEMYGCFGVTEILGYRPTYDSTWIYQVRHYSRKLPPNMPILELASQLFRALAGFHEAGVMHGSLRAPNIHWQGDQIKLVDWSACRFHGDLPMWGSWPHKEMYEPAHDMLCAGLVLKEWSKLCGADPVVDKLIDVLCNKDPGMRVSAKTAFMYLKDPSAVCIEAPVLCFDFSALLSCHRDAELGYHLDCYVHEHLLGKPAMDLPVSFCKAHNLVWAASSPSKFIGYGDFEGQPVFGKLLVGGEMQEPWKSLGPMLLWFEFFIAQLLNGKPHFPLLLDFTMFLYADSMSVMNRAAVAMAWPVYNKEPQKKDIISTALQLISAIQTMHSLGLRHGDVAPSNILWNKEDELILVGFGASGLINHHPGVNLLPGDEPFSPPEYNPTIASDVYSAGKVIEYFALHWGQLSVDLLVLIEAMTKQRPFERVSLDKVKKKLEWLMASSFR